MGWWDTDEDGASFEGDGSLVWGDGPADLLADALDEIDKEFEAAWGRKPTQTELIAGMRFSTRMRYKETEIESPGS